MRKVLVMIAICLSAMSAQAQSMSEIEKPFFETESDSIAEARIASVADELGLRDKQAVRISKLYAQQYEELCRSLQMGIMRDRMKSNATSSENAFDRISAKESFDRICRKYPQRFAREMTAEQKEIWAGMDSIKLDNRFDEILERVISNTENYF